MKINFYSVLAVTDQAIAPQRVPVAGVTPAIILEVRNNLSYLLAVFSFTFHGFIWYSLCVVPLPQSNRSLVSPACMSVDGPNLSIIGLGNPVPCALGFPSAVDEATHDEQARAVETR